MASDEGVGAGRLETETHLGESGPPVAPLGSLPSSESFDDRLLSVVNSGPLQGLIGRMLDGSEPKMRPLVYWESDKFNPTNISVVLLRVAGFQQKEIAEMVGQSAAWVSTTLKHPYGRQLTQTLVPMVAAQSLDIRRRQEAYGSVLLDKVFEMAMESEDVNEVRHITFGLLDRAGFGEIRQAKVEHSFSAPTATMDRLSKALENSARLDAMVQADFTVLPSSRDGSTAEEGSSGSPVSDGAARTPSEPPMRGSPSESWDDEAAA